MHQGLVPTTAIVAAALTSCAQEIITDRDMLTAQQIEQNFPRHPTFLKIGDGVILAVTQNKDDELRLFKSVTGYAEAGGQLTIAGTGGGLDLPLAGFYVRSYPLEVMAIMKNDWGIIQDAVLRDSKTHDNAVDADYVKLLFESITLDTLPSDQYPLNHEYTVSYSNGDRLRQDGEYVPVHIGLEDCTLLRINQSGRNISFDRTYPGYAVVGLKAQIAGNGGESEQPLADLYFDLTPGVATAHVGGDWRILYEASIRQARILPDSVEPSRVREVLCPTCEKPPGGEVILQTIDHPKVGYTVSGPVALLTDNGEMQIDLVQNTIDFRDHVLPTLPDYADEVSRAAAIEALNILIKELKKPE